MWSRRDALFASFATVRFQWFELCSARLLSAALDKTGVTKSSSPRYEEITVTAQLKKNMKRNRASSESMFCQRVRKFKMTSKTRWKRMSTRRATTPSNPFFWNEAARGTPQVSWNCSAQPWNSPEIFRNPEILVFWASRNRRFPCRKRTLLDLGHNVNIRALSGRWTDSAETSELPSPMLCHVIRCCYPMLSHVPFLILLSRQSMLVIWTQNARARRAQGRLSGDFPFALGDDFGSGHVNLFCAAGRLSGPRSTNLADRDSQYTRMISYVHSELSACIILCPKCQTW